MTFLDRYADALRKQNEGKPCPDCGSCLGHFVVCPLINRTTAEAHALVAGAFTDSDVIAAHALGVDLTL